MALTATATPRVRADIMSQLAMSSDTKWFLSSFNRTNLQVNALRPVLTHRRSCVIIRTI
jgi:bloom syndrome protein